jgi:hypothetical protein
LLYIHIYIYTYTVHTYIYAYIHIHISMCIYTVTYTLFGGVQNMVVLRHRIGPRYMSTWSLSMSTWSLSMSTWSLSMSTWSLSSLCTVPIIVHYRVPKGGSSAQSSLHFAHYQQSACITLSHTSIHPCVHYCIHSSYELMYFGITNPHYIATFRASKNTEWISYNSKKVLQFQSL